MRAFGDDFTLVEVKSATGGLPESLPETICAFANMPQGGTIILGADQRQNFSITGVDSPSDMIQGLTSQARTAVDPAPYISAYPLDINGRTVIVAEVVALLPGQKPARYQHKAYLRQSDGDYVMNTNDLQMIEVNRLQEIERTQYDAVPVPGTGTADLDGDLLAVYLESARRSSRRLRALDDESLLRMTAVTTADGTLTTAGLYALGYLPQGKLPSLAATAAVRLPRNSSGVRTQNRQDFDGPLPALLEQIQEWIRENTGTADAYRPDGNMEKRPEFPGRAIREIVANALVHRDLGPNTIDRGLRVQIRVEPEKLVIISPGGLHNLSESELSSGQFRPQAVNQRLYEISKHLSTSDGASVIEGEGGGIREALAETRDADLHRPMFIDRGVNFTVILRRGSVFSRDSSRRLAGLAPGIQLSHIQKSLLLSLDDGEPWSISRMLTDFSPLTRSEAEEQLSLLQRLSLITVSPEGVTLAGRPPTHSEVRAGPGTLSVDQDASNRPNSISPDSELDLELRKVTKNASVVFRAIPPEESTDVHSLAERTELPLTAIRYALSKLITSGYVIRTGGQGDRTTTYRRAW